MTAMSRRRTAASPNRAPRNDIQPSTERHSDALYTRARIALEYRQRITEMEDLMTRDGVFVVRLLEHLEPGMASRFTMLSNEVHAATFGVKEKMGRFARFYQMAYIANRALQSNILNAEERERYRLAHELYVTRALNESITSGDMYAFTLSRRNYGLFCLRNLYPFVREQLNLSLR